MLFDASTLLRTAPPQLLFFLACLPQFVHPERGMVWLQFLVLGGILSVIGFANSVAIAFAIGRIGHRLSARPRVALVRQRAVGALFVGLGLRLAFEQRD